MVEFLTSLKKYYNIPRKIRELQSAEQNKGQGQNYNIPRKIRELQFEHKCKLTCFNYNIPRKIRELQYLTVVLLLI